ncbi:hypothetical protein ABZ618_00815 [Streptomyces roseolus]|uniref:hypothetical protein n=1 Tax=Streptomyces roseolus TaxID=67358 RepID=UPI003408D683
MRGTRPSAARRAARLREVAGTARRTVPRPAPLLPARAAAYTTADVAARTGSTTGLGGGTERSQAPARPRTGAVRIRLTRGTMVV